jgi:hypothetical protein
LNLLPESVQVNTPKGRPEEGPADAQDKGELEEGFQVASQALLSGQITESAEGGVFFSPVFIYLHVEIEIDRAF